PPRHRIAGVVSFADSEHTTVEHHRQGKCFFRTLATALPDHHRERPFTRHADVNIRHPVNQAFPSPHPVRFFIRPPESTLVCGIRAPGKGFLIVNGGEYFQCRGITPVLR
ncbi:hypothetical protein ECEC1846_1596, partial [Escherichia coli EC1846]